MKRKTRTRLLRTALIVAALLTLPLASALAQASEPATIVYVVRHAERAEDGTNDPPISDAGEARARLLIPMLRDVALTHIHTTDFRRTRSTVAPIAAETGIDPRLYDPRDLSAFADRLRATPGRHVVVGHSNTNPELVAALGGDGGAPIEEMEYDRAYVVVVRGGEFVGSAIFRFGPGGP
jgi:probable phosphoglycerate mutase